MPSYFNSGIYLIILSFKSILPSSASFTIAMLVKILVIDASKDYLDAKNQNFLRKEDIDKTAAAFDSFETVERYCTVADMEEIEENDYNLNISRYVDTTEPEEPVDIHAVIKNLNELESDRKDVQSKLDDYLRDLKINDWYSSKKSDKNYSW